MRRVVLTCSMVLLGCSGDDSDAAASGSGGSDGGPTEPLMDCPAQPPQAGTACQRNTPAQCEYGDHFDPQCNTLVTCTYNQTEGPENARWNVVPPPAGCTDPANPAGCAADYASITDRSECTDLGTLCSYPEGTCGCVQDYKDEGFPQPLWVCEPLAAGCPATRPPLGSPCPADLGEEFLRCDYGRCLGGGRVSVLCRAEAHWAETFVECMTSPENPG